MVFSYLSIQMIIQLQQIVENKKWVSQNNIQVSSLTYQNMSYFLILWAPHLATEKHSPRLTPFWLNYVFIVISDIPNR